jgi:hypothetical protein
MQITADKSLFTLKNPTIIKQTTTPLAMPPTFYLAWRVKTTFETTLGKALRALF